jgi:predicted ribonuclease YlaK
MAGRVGAELLDLPFPDTTVHIFVPIVVIDELDRLKEHAPTRWRAGYTRAVIDRIFKVANAPAVLRPAEADRSRGQVVMELVFDPPGHVRLPIAEATTLDSVPGQRAAAVRRRRRRRTS